jgi:hypothetical protein
MAAYSAAWAGWRPELEAALLVQCLPAQAELAAAVADRPGAGLVVTRRPSDLNGDAAVEAVRLVRDGGYRRPVLLDAGRYAGPGRNVACDPFDLDWIATQRRLRLPVLTDSGYLGADDTAGLELILSRTRLFGGSVIATLPLHPAWLSHRGRLAMLVDRVGTAGVPVAVAVEHARDPLGAPGVLAGLLELLGLDLPVLLLRAGSSVLGALCHGAAGAAVGTSAALRHFQPPGRARRGEIAAVVKQCLAYVGLDRIAAAAQADPDDQMWVCGCSTCNERTLDWLATIESRTERERAAFTHSAEVLMDLRDELHRVAGPARAASWRAHLANAAARYAEIAAESGAAPRPEFLPAWLSATDRARARPASLW